MGTETDMDTDTTTLMNMDMNNFLLYIYIISGTSKDQLVLQSLYNLRTGAIHSTY